MPLDPDVETLLKMVQEANRPSFETVGAIAARELFMAGRKALSPDPMPIAETRDIAIPGPGGPIPRGSTVPRRPASCPCSCSFMAAAGSSAISRATRRCAGISRTARNALSLRSITASPPSTNSRRRSMIVSRRPNGSRRTRASLGIDAPAGGRRRQRRRQPRRRGRQPAGARQGAPRMRGSS